MQRHSNAKRGRRFETASSTGGSDQEVGECMPPSTQVPKRGRYGAHIPATINKAGQTTEHKRPSKVQYADEDISQTLEDDLLSAPTTPSALGEMAQHHSPPHTERRNVPRNTIVIETSPTPIRDAIPGVKVIEKCAPATHIASENPKKLKTVLLPSIVPEDAYKTATASSSELTYQANTARTVQERMDRAAIGHEIALLRQKLNDLTAIKRKYDLESVVASDVVLHNTHPENSTVDEKILQDVTSEQLNIASQNEAVRCILTSVKETAPPRSRRFWDIGTTISPPLSTMQVRSVLRGESFRAMRPFAQLGTFDSKLCTLDPEGRFSWKKSAHDCSLDGFVMGVMTGVVTLCNIVEPMKYTPRGGDPQYHRRIVITPSYESFKHLQSFLYDITGKEHLKAQLENGSDLVFTTRKGTKTLGKKRVPAKERNFSEIRAEDNESDIWYQRSLPAYLDFEDDLPILDASRSGFNFDGPSFEALHSLPRYESDIASRKIDDLDFGDTVAVLYTGNMFNIPTKNDSPRTARRKRGKKQDENPPEGGENWVGFNCHAVIYLAPGVEDLDD